VLLQKATARAKPSPPRFPGAAADSSSLLRPLQRRKGGGIPDLCVRAVNRMWVSVVDGGVGVGVAPPYTTFWSSRSVLPLAGVPCCGDGSVEVPPRGRRFDADDRVSWGFRPWSLPSSYRRLLQRRCGLSKVCWRSSGYPSLWPFGEGDEDLLPVVLGCSSPSSSCGYAETEIGDFPTASILPAEQGFSPALRGSGGGSAAARLWSVSASEEEWIRDLVVIFVFFEVPCTTVEG
jgi:hypothetical protein